ncbi:MAG: hypothetical protein H7138_22570 [Myxococcales bacterium]|nr:hypothetical protein [Myxococcales bacterium]
MGFGPPAAQFSLSLRQATPTPFDVPDVRAQMANVGLSCAQLTDQAIQSYISTVKSQMNDGTAHAWGIVTAADAETTSKTATANWEPTSNAEGYNTIFATILYPQYFDWLMQNAQQYTFPGVTNTNNRQDFVSTSDAITTFFANTANTASSTMVKGIDQSAMCAAFTNAIQGVDPNLSDYSPPPQNRVIYMVDNYDPGKGTADGIGAVRVDWTLKIVNYKHKAKDGGTQHQCTIDLTARGVFYSDSPTLCAAYHAVRQQFASNFKGPELACPVP